MDKFILLHQGICNYICCDYLNEDKQKVQLPTITEFDAYKMQPFPMHADCSSFAELADTWKFSYDWELQYYKLLDCMPNEHFIMGGTTTVYKLLDGVPEDTFYNGGHNNSPDYTLVHQGAILEYQKLKVEKDQVVTPYVLWRELLWNRKQSNQVRMLVVVLLSVPGQLTNGRGGGLESARWSCVCPLQRVVSRGMLAWKDAVQ